MYDLKPLLMEDFQIISWVYFLFILKCWEYPFKKELNVHGKIPTIWNPFILIPSLNVYLKFYTTLVRLTGLQFGKI